MKWHEFTNRCWPKDGKIIMVVLFVVKANKANVFLTKAERNYKELYIVITPDFDLSWLEKDTKFYPVAWHPVNKKPIEWWQDELDRVVERNSFLVDMLTFTGKLLPVGLKIEAFVQATGEFRPLLGGTDETDLSFKDDDETKNPNS
jgi:hypothetical protein